MNEAKKKNSVYFYFGIAAALCGLAMMIYHAAQYNVQVAYYVAQGYEEAVVKESITFLATVLPNVSSAFTTYGILAAVLFGINSILAALKPTPAPAFVAESTVYEPIGKTIDVESDAPEADEPEKADEQ